MVEHGSIDGSGFRAAPAPLPKIWPPVRFERIDDEIRPYFSDDPHRSAFPDDGRVEPEVDDG